MIIKLMTYMLISLSIFANNPKSDSEKIDYLLNRVKNSDAIFIRNGESYNSSKAYEHLKFKINYAKKAFIFFGPEKDISVSDFIEKIASKSSSTGKPYYIKPRDGKKVLVKEWMLEKLAELQNVSDSKRVRNKDQKI